MAQQPSSESTPQFSNLGLCHISSTLLRKDTLYRFGFRFWRDTHSFLAYEAAFWWNHKLSFFSNSKGKWSRCSQGFKKSLVQRIIFQGRLSKWWNNDSGGQPPKILFSRSYKILNRSIVLLNYCLFLHSCLPQRSGLYTEFCNYLKLSFLIWKGTLFAFPSRAYLQEHFVSQTLGTKKKENKQCLVRYTQMIHKSHSNFPVEPYSWFVPRE